MGIVACAVLLSACTQGVTKRRTSPPASAAAGPLLNERTDQPPEAPEARWRDIAMAGRQPPHDAGSPALARFYLERGAAASRIGRARQAIDDLTRANSLSAGLPPKARIRILRLLSLMESTAGNRDRAIRFLRHAIAIADAFYNPAEESRYKILINARLARELVKSRNLLEARRHLSKASHLIERFSLMNPSKRHGKPNFSQDWPNGSGLFLGSLFWAQADVRLSLGRFAEAEAAYRKSLAYFSEEISVMPGYPAGNEDAGFNDGRRAFQISALLLGLASALRAQGQDTWSEIHARQAVSILQKKLGRGHFMAAAGIRDLGEILDAKGRFAQAEASFRKYLQILSRSGAERGIDTELTTRVKLASNLVRQGRWAKAYAQFNAVKDAIAGDVTKLHRFVNGNYDYALTLIAQGRPAEALTLARSAKKRAQDLLGNDHLKAGVAGGIAALALVEQGRNTEAQTEFEHASAVLLKHASSMVTGGRQRATDWNAKMILESYLRFLTRHGKGPGHSRIARSDMAKAFRIADVLRGRASQRALEAAAERAGAGSAELAKLLRRQQDITRRLRAATISFLANVAQGKPRRMPPSDNYPSPIQHHIMKLNSEASSPPGNGFEGLLEHFSQYGERTQPSRPDDYPSPTQHHIMKLHGEASSPHATSLERLLKQRHELDHDHLRELIAALRREHAIVVGDIRRRFPKYATLTGRPPPTIGQVQEKLRSQEALIALYASADQTYVWAVPNQGKPAFAAVPMGTSELNSLVARLRRGINPKGANISGVPRFDVEAARTLFEVLLSPVAAGWTSARDLFVVAHGPLATVPFSVLVTGETAAAPTPTIPFAEYQAIPWLARTHAVTALPTISSLITLRGTKRRIRKRRNFLGFADPLFNKDQAGQAEARPEKARSLAQRGAPFVLRALPAKRGSAGMRLRDLPRLPETAREIRNLAGILHADATRDVFIGPRANEQEVKSPEVSRYRIVSFASHALLPGEIEGLAEPAIAMTAPEIAGVEGDGLLTISEILGLKLDADWVVLSACNTAASSGKGRESVSGLVRSFFFAGARAVLATHWRIESESASTLITDMFRRQAADPRLSGAQALRQAKLGLIDGPGYVDGERQTLFSYAHPLFWAPFTIYGENTATP